MLHSTSRFWDVFFYEVLIYRREGAFLSALALVSEAVLW